MRYERVLVLVLVLVLAMGVIRIFPRYSRVEESAMLR